MSTVHAINPGNTQPVKREPTPLPTVAQMLAAYRQVEDYAKAQDRARNLPELPSHKTLTPAMAVRLRQEALQQRRQLLSTRSGDKAFEAVCEARIGPGDPDVISALAAQLLDCFPPDKLGNPRAFFEALVFDLSESGYSNTIIAAACVELRRTSRFRPSISEVLDCCKRKDQFVSAVSAGRRPYYARQLRVHLVLHHSGGDPDKAENEAHSPAPNNPTLVAEYAKGPENDWWYDYDLNTDLQLRDDEADGWCEVWQARFDRMKAEAEADPEAHRLKVERARGAREGWRIANEYHKRSGLDRRRQAVQALDRMAAERFPDNQPSDLFRAWDNGAMAAVMERFDELEPNYAVEERARHERAERERVELEAHWRRYRKSQALRAG